MTATHPARTPLAAPRRVRSGAAPGVTRIAHIALHLLFAALGVLLGLFGAFVVPLGPRVGGTLLSAGVLVAIAGNVTAARLGVAGLGRWGGVGPLFGWLIVALALGATRPGGSVVLAGGDLSVSSYLFLFGGAVGGAVAALVRTGPVRTSTRSSP